MLSFFHVNGVDNYDLFFLLEPISPFLQGLEEAHEKVIAHKVTLMISLNGMKGCDPLLLIQPNRLIALLLLAHKAPPHKKIHSFTPVT